MILADKIINERKKLGWSQEELAEKLGVTRQSVSKWEGAQAVPDLQKILAMAEIFGVTTDYLLKDEIEELTTNNIVAKEDVDSTLSKRRVSLEEASAFIEMKAKTAPKLAFATALCIFSPVVLILFAGLSDEKIFGITENLASGIGLVALFACIVSAVLIFMNVGNQGKDFDYIHEEDIETAYGVSGMVKEKAKAFEKKYSLYNTIGVVLCICCAIPLIIAALAECSDIVLILMTCVLLTMVAVGVAFFILAGNEHEAHEALLQEGEFTAKRKVGNKKLAPYAGIYWCLVTALFLGLGFYFDNWERTALIWPVAGVLYVVYRKVVKLALKID